MSDYETIRALCWAFLVGSQFFRLLPAAEIWLVAVSLVITDVVGLLLLSKLYAFEPTLLRAFSWAQYYYAVPIHSVSIGLAFAWWLLRGLPRSLGKRWACRDQLWVVGVPASGLVVDFIPSKFISSVEAAVLAVIVQLGVIGMFAVRPMALVDIGRFVSMFVSPVVDRTSLKKSPDRETILRTDTQIDTTQSIGRPVLKKKILLSYRREDSADVTGRIYDRLVQQFGRQQVFKDVDSIPFGVDFRKHLHQLVESCDVVVAVIGDRWNGPMSQEPRKRLDDAKDYVRIELEAALQRDILVIPVLVRGAQIPAESDLPSTLAPLAYRNGLSVRPDPDFHRDMDRLIEGLVSHFG